MSMLIIGVNPPKSCYACSWYNKVECPVNDGRYYYRAQRHPSCPLIELPPHGRLIDATFEENHYGSMLLTIQPDKDKVSNLLYHIYSIQSPHLDMNGVIAKKYYCEELWKELFGKGSELPGWMN